MDHEHASFLSFIFILFIHLSFCYILPSSHTGFLPYTIPTFVSNPFKESLLSPPRETDGLLPARMLAWIRAVSSQARVGRLLEGEGGVQADAGDCLTSECWDHAGLTRGLWENIPGV